MASNPNRTHDFRWMLAIWLVLTVAGELVYWFVIGPHMPPGAMSDSASGQQFDFNVLSVTALPVVFGVWVYLGYAIVNWRASRSGGEEEPSVVVPPRRQLRIQISWITVTTLLVLWAFGFGVYELVVPAGAGGGEGPNPIWTPTSHEVLPVQVIGQQWLWTYRYPTFGGFETTQLMLPDNTTIAFHVTSLDVIHDFWAYQLGVKADANPDVDDIAYTTTRQVGTVTVRCDELCGLWHGAMFDFGKVVTKSQFYSWAKSTEARLADSTKYLPPFAWTYNPDANGADGGYYPDNHDLYSKIESYGSTVVKEYGATDAGVVVKVKQ